MIRLTSAVNPRPSHEGRSPGRPSAAATTAPPRRRGAPAGAAAAGSRERTSEAAPARLAAADVLRVVGVVGVVAVHAAHWPSTVASIDGEFWNGMKLVTRYCVPVFVVLSGLLLGLRTPSPLAAGGFLGRRFRRSLLPWVVWMPVYFASGYLITNDITHSVYGATDWVAGGGGHLYFLLLAPQFYLVYLLWPERLGSQVVIAGLAVAAQAFLCAWRLGDLPDIHVLRDLVLWHAYEEFPFWIGYFAVGVVIGHLHRVGSWRPSPPLALACVVLLPVAVALLVLSGTDGSPGLSPFATGTGSFLRPLLLPVVLLISAAVLLGAPGLLAERRLPRWMALLSRHALGVYILQALLIYIPGRLLFPLLDRALPLSAIGFLVLVPATLALATLGSAVLERTPLAVAVGLSRQPWRWRTSPTESAAAG